MLAVVLWVSAIAAIAIGLRFKVKPILLVGALDGLLAMFVTLLAASMRRNPFHSHNGSSGNDR